MNLDLSGDYLVWDFPEPVVYQSTRTAGNMLDVVSVARRQQVDARELEPSAGVYTGADLDWFLPAALLTSAALGVPKPGDVVLDQPDGNPWTVQTVTATKRDAAGYQTYKLRCRNLDIAFDLRHLIDVERPAISNDAAGAVLRGWPPAQGTVPYRGLKARVQKLTDESVEVYDVRGFQGTHAIIVSRELSLGSEDRVKWVSGGVTYYLDIKGYHNAARIDVLPIIDAELMP